MFSEVENDENMLKVKDIRWCILTL